jgi:hypothetical protein
VSAATHLYRRKAMYYWRRRLPNALASWFHRRHLFLSLQTPDPNFARRLVVLLDAKLEEVVTAFEHAEMHLTPAQVDGLLRDVVTNHRIRGGGHSVLRIPSQRANGKQEAKVGLGPFRIRASDRDSRFSCGHRISDGANQRKTSASCCG